MQQCGEPTEACRLVHRQPRSGPLHGCMLLGLLPKGGRRLHAPRLPRSCLASIFCAVPHSHSLPLVGALTATFVCPLDVLKTRLQVQRIAERQGGILGEQLGPQPLLPRLLSATSHLSSSNLFPLTLHLIAPQLAWRG
jgi:hypothetical protein